MAKASRSSDQFPLRLPPGMRDQIKRAAEESGRSMNSEILDVLREYFPEDPSLPELIEAFDYAVAMLRELKEYSTTADPNQSNKFLTLLGRMDEINDQLWNVISKDRLPTVVKLRPEVTENISKLQVEWELPRGPIDNLASDLIQMSLNRISSGEENLKVWIGEGDHQRMLELQKPTPNGDEKNS